MEKYIDLHTHSIASDGTDTPEELILKAKAANLSAIALTDHDTIDGLEQAQKIADEIGIELVQGIELSCQLHTKEVHILGYWLNKEDLKHIHSPKLQNIINEVRAYREERNIALLKKLNTAGIDLTFEDIFKTIDTENNKATKNNKVTENNKITDIDQASKIFHTNNKNFNLNKTYITHDISTICRPHFALAMVQKGYAKDIRSAFKKYLGDKAIAYIPKTRLNIKEAITALRESKAFVVYAHPYLTPVRNPKERKAQIKEMKDLGLQGLECYYSTNSKDQTIQSIFYAKEFALGITGGSDYHGAVKPNIKLGSGQGNLKIDYSVLERLREFEM